MRILRFESHTDNRRFLFQVTAAATITATSMISQNYLSAVTGKMLAASNVSDVETKQKAKYYTIRNFEVLPQLGRWHTDFRTSGKYRQYLDVTLFYVCPIADHEDPDPGKQYKWWYALQFDKTLNNKSSDAVIEMEYDAFARVSAYEVSKYNFHQLTYFERLLNSDDRDNFLQAVAGEGEGIDTAHEILVPQKDPLTSRAGNLLPWTFGSFAIGLSVFLLLLIWPDYSKNELGQQRVGQKRKQDDMVDMLNYLIPKPPHAGSSILLNLNILVYLLMIFSGIHILYPNASELLPWGALRRDEVLNGEWWRLITCTFIHGGAMHLMLNIAGLVLASSVLEQLLNTTRYFILYLASAVGGSVASIMWHENTVSVGASGAIFGLFGAIITFAVTNVIPKYDQKFMLYFYGGYIAINLLIGLTGGIDNAAHIGGLLTGAAVAVFIHKPGDERISF